MYNILLHSTIDADEMSEQQKRNESQQKASRLYHGRKADRLSGIFVVGRPVS